jgi:methyl-accepting chemotaxis protein
MNFIVKDREIFYSDKSWGNWVRCMPPPENFLKTVGYSLGDIKGKHHSMFCETEYAESPEYKQLWEKLNHGEFQSGEYKRLGKNGKEVFIIASYNPMIGDDGKPYKVVKFATDVNPVIDP